MNKKFIYFSGLVTLTLGYWLFAGTSMGFLNSGSFIMMAILMVMLAYPIAMATRIFSHKVWFYTGIFILAVLLIPISKYKMVLPAGDADPYSLSISFTNLFLISTALVVTALLIHSVIDPNQKNRDLGLGENGSIQEQPKKPFRKTIVILILILCLLAKAGHNFYWLMIWDSTTDSLNWIWLLIPIMSVIFSSFLLFFTLPKRMYLAGLLYLLLIPSVISIYALTRQVDFRQLTDNRAKYVSHKIETYQARVGRYPQELSELQPWYNVFPIPEPVILYGEDWCYEGGNDYYRLGYVNRLHWSDPRLIGEVYKIEGNIPDLSGMCAEEIATIQDRFPEYPYVNWVERE